MRKTGGFNTSYAYELTSGKGRSVGSNLSGFSAEPKTAFGNIIKAANIVMYLGLEDNVGSSSALNEGSGPDLDLKNGVALNANGVFKKAAHFDGLNQAVQSSPGTFPFDAGQSSDYSISMWVRPEAYPGDSEYNGLDTTCYLLSNTNVGFGTRWGFMILLTSTLSAYGVNGAVVYQPKHGATTFGVGSGFRNTDSQFLLEKNRWHHIAINRDIINGVELWINGSLAVQDTFNETSTDPSTGDITICCRGNEGASTFNNRNTFQGTVDEVFLIDRTLTKTEISQIYALGNNP